METKEQSLNRYKEQSMSIFDKEGQEHLRDRYVEAYTEFTNNIMWDRLDVAATEHNKSVIKTLEDKTDSLYKEAGLIPEQVLERTLRHH